MLNPRIFLIVLCVLGAALLLPIAGEDSGLSPIPAAWAGFSCNADGDDLDRNHPKCGGTDPDDNNPCDPDPEHPACPTSGGGGGDGGGSTAPDPYNLARASFATKEELYPGLSSTDLENKGGVFADGVDQGLCPPYDYWDWQEALLPDGVRLNCDTYLNSSNVSGGGRWFLISSPAGSEEVLNEIERWLVVDFSDPSDSVSPCYDLDYGGTGTDYSELGVPLYLDYTDSQVGPVNQIDKNPNPCIDHLAVRLSADRILKPKANQQQLDFSIRWRPDPGASIYWPPWGYVSWINPLYLREPSAGDPQEWIDAGCRVMSTRPPHGDPEGENRDEAELLREIGPGQTVLLGTYHLPMEVCVKRASD